MAFRRFSLLMLAGSATLGACSLVNAPADVEPLKATGSGASSSSGGAGGTASGGSASGGSGGSGGALVSCTGDPECKTDDDPCTIQKCVAQICQTTTTDPEDNDACTTDSCDAATGAAKNEAIVLEDNDLCTFDRCDPSSGVSHDTEVVIFSDDFSGGNTAGWSVGSPWQIGAAQPSGVPGQAGPFLGWPTDPAQDHSAGNDNMLAGVAIGTAISYSVGAMRYLESPTFDASSLPAGGQLVFSYYRRLVSESTIYNVVHVDVFDGSNWVNLFVNDTQYWVDTDWQKVSHDVSSHASSQMKVRFGFEALSLAYTDMPNWSLDDVKIAAVPINVDDADACTIDSCHPTNGAVNQALVVDDSNACTRDACDAARGLSHRDISRIFVADFWSEDTFAPVWGLGAEWAIGPAVSSNTDPAADTSPDAANRLAGVVIGGNYAGGIHPMYYLTSPEFSVSSAATSNLELSFSRWLASDVLPANMTNVIEVWNSVTNTWVEVWRPTATELNPFDKAWGTQTYDLSPLVPPAADGFSPVGVRVRFGFESLVNAPFSRGGWSVDDIVVRDGTCDSN